MMQGREEGTQEMSTPTIEAAHAMGTKGGPVVEAERLAFEAWMAGHCWALGATWDGKHYIGEAEKFGDLSPRAMITRQLWAAWRDRAALSQQPATPEPVAWMASYVDPIGNDHVYVTSHHDLAVENDMHGTPRPLYTRPAPSVPDDVVRDAERVPMTDERSVSVKVDRELFRFHSEQDWVNKARSRYANCVVQKGHYITVDAAGHVMHMGLCFKHAVYPVTVYQLQTNWPKEKA